MSGVLAQEMGEEDEEDVDHLKALSGSDYDRMDDDEYVQAVEERVQRGKEQGMEARKELLTALEEKD